MLGCVVTKGTNLKNRIAKYFDVNHGYWIVNPRLSVRKEYLSLLGEVSGKTVLDMGCGLGFDAQLLVEQGATGIGVDISTKSVEFCRKRELSNWRFTVADSEEVKFKEKFDILISSMELMYHPEPAVALSHYGRFITSSGQLLLVINNPYLVAFKNGLDYQIPSSYSHSFTHIKGDIVKYHYPLESILKILCTQGLKLIYLKEIYCEDKDSRNFAVDSEYGFPEFIAILFGR